MLQVFSIHIYSFLDAGATLCFATPLVSIKDYVLHETVIEYSLVSIPVGDSVVTKIEQKNYPISLLHKVTQIYLVDLVFDIYVI